MMNINSHITGMNTCNASGNYIAMASHPATPSILESMATGVPAVSWFMHSIPANPYPWQSFVFPPNPVLPVLPTFQHQLFNSASPPPPNNNTNKSFLIKDILGTTDSTSQTTLQVTGRSQMFCIFMLYNVIASETVSSLYKQSLYSQVTSSVVHACNGQKTIV